MLRAVPGAQRGGVAVTPAESQQVSTKQDPLLVRGSAAEAPSVTRRWKLRVELGSTSWALTSLGCPESCPAPPASEPLTRDHQTLVITASVAGSSFPAPEPLLSLSPRSPPFPLPTEHPAYNNCSIHISSLPLLYTDHPVFSPVSIPSFAA